MKTTLRYIGLNVRTTWNQLLQGHLNQLKRLADIESAEVILEQRRESAPAFRAKVVLAVPGPDIHAEAIDHTLAAALHKAVEDLARQIRTRQTNRQVRGKSNLQLGTISRRWSSAFAFQRA